VPKLKQSLMSASADRAVGCAFAERGRFARVALDVPASQVGASLFDYAVPDGAEASKVQVGAWVLVPWGRARRIGLVVALSEQPAIDAARVKTLERVLDDAPLLPAAWFELVAFAARYYHRGEGEVAMPAIPKRLRTPVAASAGSADDVPAPGRRTRGSAFERARSRWLAQAHRGETAGPPPGQPSGAQAPGAQTLGVERPARALNDAQQRVLDALRAGDGFAVHLLHGVTGSGKTEVYLHWLAGILARDARSQVLLLVPEIALTPQLHAQLAARFPRERVALLHSEMADAERAAHWLAVVEGRARVVLGTRLAVLAPFPALAAIVVDEEHDASYKQQEGVRYSARDLAIAAASQRRVPIVLGSATPSLETWFAVRRGRYRSHTLHERIGSAALPVVECVDLAGGKLRHSLAPRVVEAIEATLARGEQALVFVNRRGYAPVLSCAACGWLSRCANCSAYRVLHRIDAAAAQGEARRARPSRYRLVCHHCAAEQSVPRACPDCGNVDLDALGRGTQRLEEALVELFPQRRIARLDRDVARRRGAAQRVLDAAHAGEVDLLVGTQMLAKGHDFRRLALVVALDVDAGLYAADFRAPERLFATLMQVAGRAGRGGAASRMLVQTRYPGHPLFAFLARHDYAGFADRLLSERRETGLPPYRHQAMLRADARELADALAFLEAARELAATREARDGVRVYDAVPMAMSRLQGRERAQLLVESDRRAPLHRFLSDWTVALHATAPRVSWQLDVDPLEI